MNTTRRRLFPTFWIAALLCLAPSMAWADGWDAVEGCFRIAFWGAGVGCVVGVGVAWVRRARNGGWFGWTIGGGLALGLGGLFMFMLTSQPLNPDFFGFALISVIGTAVISAVGGGLLAMLAWAIRSRFPPKDRNRHPPPPA